MAERMSIVRSRHSILRSLKPIIDARGRRRRGEKTARRIKAGRCILLFQTAAETVSKGGDAVIKLLAVMSPIGLAVSNVLVGRYLGAFGHPGLVSFGPTIDYLLLVLLMTFAIFVILGLFVGAPLFVRHIWTSPDGRSFRRQVDHRWTFAPWRLAIAHAAGLIGLATSLIPGAPEPVFWTAVAVGGLIGLAWTWRGPAGAAGMGPWLAHLAQGVSIVFSVNLILLLWVATLQPPIKSLLYSGAENAISVEAAGLWAVGILVFLYSLMTVFPWKAAVPVAFVALCALVFSVGDRALVGLTLRTANLGGGAPVVYRPTGLGEAARSRTACLVFAAGDMRIVWIPQAVVATSNGKKSAETCDFTAFRRRLEEGGRAWDAGRFPKADDVRAFRGEAFYSPS